MHGRSTEGRIFSYWKGLELLDVQSKTQDASCLPALRVSDIEPTIPITPVQMGSAGTAQCPRCHSSQCTLFFCHHQPGGACFSSLNPHRWCSSSVLRAAHKRLGLLQSDVQSQHSARGPEALRAALLQRHHQVSSSVCESRTRSQLHR